MKLSILLILLFNSFSPGETGELKIKIQNIHPTEGKLYIAIYDNTDNFLNTDSAAYYKIASISAENELVIIPDMKIGTYAISIFHDLNGNGKLDANMIGIPKEPYGFSNNSMGRFGPPKFKNAAFEFSGDMKIDIKLMNNDKE